MNKIKVLYEDNHIIVVEKPINMLSQSDNTKDIDLLTLVKEYIKEKYHKPGNVYVGLVHRLDRPVGGVMVFAKTSKAAKRLSEEIRTHQIKKTYLAIVEGIIKEETGTYCDKILRLENGNSVIDSHGKEAILDYDEKLVETISELKKQNYEVLGYKVDIRNVNAVKEAISDISSKWGKIDILVNNAGVCRLKPFSEMEDELRDFHFDINIKGTWNVTKATLPYMEKGSIINLSSVTGPIVADSGEVAYATTKAALIGFTKGLAAELVDKNIRVNAIMPGYIMTPMVSGMAKESNAENPDSVVDGIAKGIPMKRLGTIEELGNLAAFLASDESSYITAQGIVIDGGSTLPETMTMGV